MDVGGVACISCVKRLEIQSPQPMQVIVRFCLKDATVVSYVFFELVLFYLLKKFDGL